MARKLRDARPDGQHPLRNAVWEFLRPMLSRRLAALHRDAFVISPDSTVDLAAHRGESSLDWLDLNDADAAQQAPGQRPADTPAPCSAGVGTYGRAGP
jgi:hypothetical protein